MQSDGRIRFGACLRYIIEVKNQSRLEDSTAVGLYVYGHSIRCVQLCVCCCLCDYVYHQLSCQRLGTTFESNVYRAI